MLASSVEHTTNIIFPKNIVKHKSWQNSHRTCSNPFLFLLLFYDTQATNLSIVVEMGGLGNLTRKLGDKNDGNPRGCGRGHSPESGRGRPKKSDYGCFRHGCGHPRKLD